jgi:hypothetical protein
MPTFRAVRAGFSSGPAAGFALFFFGATFGGSTLDAKMARFAPSRVGGPRTADVENHDLVGAMSAFASSVVGSHDAEDSLAAQNSGDGAESAACRLCVLWAVSLSPQSLSVTKNTLAEIL